MNKYAAFFDVDDTILADNSGKLMVKYAYQRGVINKVDILQGYYNYLLYKIGFKTPEHLVIKMSSWLRGFSEHKLLDFSNDFFDKIVIPYIRKQAQKEIDLHQKKNARTVILSATTNYLCSPLKDHLNMDDIICTVMEVINGTLSGSSHGAFCYGIEKLKRLRRYCKEHCFDLQDTYYYTDSISDLPVLEAVGYPVCVTPDAKLERVAQERNWPIMNW